MEQGWTVAALIRRDLPDDPVFASAITRTALRIYRADLADAVSRRSAVGEIAKHEPRLDLLFNNAGVATGTLQFSPQNRELHFEVNCIAPFVLADGLTPALAAAGGRIINTVSDAVFMTRRYDPETLANPPGRFRRIIGPYATSKLALALWSKALATSLAKRGVTIISVTPGPIATSLNSSPGMPLFMRPLVRLHGETTGLRRKSPAQRRRPVLSLRRARHERQAPPHPLRDRGGAHTAPRRGDREAVATSLKSTPVPIARVSSTDPSFTTSVPALRAGVHTS